MARGGGHHVCASEVLGGQWIGGGGYQVPGSEVPGSQLPTRGMQYSRITGARKSMTRGRPIKFPRVFQRNHGKGGCRTCGEHTTAQAVYSHHGEGPSKAAAPHTDHQAGTFSGSGAVVVQGGGGLYIGLAGHHDDEDPRVVRAIGLWATERTWRLSIGQMSAPFVD